MIGFITDENNDLTLDKLGNIKMAEGLDVYRQNLVNDIKLQLEQLKEENKTLR